MTQPSSLRRVFGATVHYGLPAYLPRLINFILLPVYAQFLSPEQFGILEICIAAQVLMQAFSRLGLPGALARDYVDERSADESRDLVTTIAIATLVASAFFTLVGFLFGPAMVEAWFPGVPVHPYLELALTSSFLQLAPELQSRILQAQEASRTAAKINLLVSVVGTLLRLMFVVGLQMEAVGALIGEVLGAMFGAAIAIVRHAPELRGRFRWPLLRSALDYGLPIVPHRLGNAVQERAGQWVLGMLGVLAAIGQLGMAGRMLAPIRTATQAFATAFPPVYYKWRNNLSKEEALKEIRASAEAAVALAGLAGVGAATLGPFVIRQFMPAEYAGAIMAVGILSAGTVVRVIYNCTGIELLYMRKTKPVPLIFGLSAVATILATYLLVRPLGLLGVALADLGGTLLAIALTAALAMRSFPFPFSLRSVASLLVTCTGMSIFPLMTFDLSFFLDLAVSAGAFLLMIPLLIWMAGVDRQALVRALRRRTA